MAADRAGGPVNPDKKKQMEPFVAELCQRRLKFPHFAARKFPTLSLHLVDFSTPFSSIVSADSLRFFLASPWLSLSATLVLAWVEDRATLGSDPSAIPGARPEWRFNCLHSLFAWISRPAYGSNPLRAG